MTESDKLLTPALLRFDVHISRYGSKWIRQAAEHEHDTGKEGRRYLLKKRTSLQIHLLVANVARWYRLKTLQFWKNNNDKNNFWQKCAKFIYNVVVCLGSVWHSTIKKVATLHIALIRK